jgi:sugar O-acyltransferase (sialic acid O-acetyltransferase NeuD family)
VNDVFIIAITSCQIKKNLHSVLKNRGAKFISIVHPSSFLTQGVNMGEGCIISRECILSNDSKIGSFVTFNARAVIGHDTVINDYAHIDTSVFIGGNCIIGTEATLYTKAIILQGLEVSEKVIVGAGSVVVKNITKPCTVFGSPARIIM